MPYKDPEKQREAVAEASRRYREKKKNDAAFKANEAERKARWYASDEGKKKKREAQRAWQKTPEGKKKMADAQRRYQAKKKLEKIL